MYGDEPLRRKRLLLESEYQALVAVEHLGRDGWPVSVREVQAYRGLASPSGPHQALVSLEACGLVSTHPRWPSRRGGWRITDDGRAVVNA